jgi:hypothetical protein
MDTARSRWLGHRKLLQGKREANRGVPPAGLRVTSAGREVIPAGTLGIPGDLRAEATAAADWGAEVMAADTLAAEDIPGAVLRAVVGTARAAAVVEEAVVEGSESPSRAPHLTREIDLPAEAGRVKLIAVTSVWGRHGFDGSDCGKEAYRSACIRNRVQKHNCQSKPGIRSLIN